MQPDNEDDQQPSSAAEHYGNDYYFSLHNVWLQVVVVGHVHSQAVDLPIVAKVFVSLKEAESSNHENNLNHLKAEKRKLDDSILHLQVTLGKSESSSKATICDMDNPLPMNDDETTARGRGDGRGERPEAVAVTEKVVVVATKVAVVVAMGDVQPCGAYRSKRPRRKSKVRARGDGRSEVAVAITVAAWVTLKVAEGEEAQEGNENEGKN
ncbi:hypothetical protein Fmac_020283 [Flemingia macrophylla]|uniref:Uncharacterized protein n=1 Tax=Flemingia macrophylla TaxID=520843 RepID=A0ABD1LTQ9_9FABA